MKCFAVGNLDMVFAKRCLTLALRVKTWGDVVTFFGVGLPHPKVPQPSL